MGGFCSTLQYRHVVDPATYTVNEVDKRIQKKQGQKTAEQLAMQNGRFADEPERQRDRLEKRLGPQEEGKWVGRAGRAFLCMRARACPAAAREPLTSPAPPPRRATRAKCSPRRRTSRSLQSTCT